MRYEVVIPARNEEKHLETTLQSILCQTIPPDHIIVVDDGSSDSTYDIAKSLADIVIKLPDRGYSALGTPEIPKVFNKGLEHISKSAKFVLICGADTLLPCYYMETILERMCNDPKLVIASGTHVKDIISKSTHPHGTRVVRIDFWRKINNLKYPEQLGWEDWLLFKAYQIGKKAERIPELITIARRNPFDTKLRNAFSLGKTMNVLGYHWFYALLRSARFFFHKPRSGVNMIAGYISSTSGEKLDVSIWVRSNQKNIIIHKIHIYLKGFF